MGDTHRDIDGLSGFNARAPAIESDGAQTGDDVPVLRPKSMRLVTEPLTREYVDALDLVVLPERDDLIRTPRSY
jgi:hypothetical protein